MIYEIDENGETIDAFVDPFEKLEKIKEKLEDDLKRLKEKYEMNEESQYPRKLNFNVNIVSSILIVCNSFPKIPFKYALCIDVDTFKRNVSAFMELWAWVKSFYPDFVCSKTLFTNFMGISSSAYSQILTTTQDVELLSEIELLNDTLCEVEIASAQAGVSKEKTTTVKLGAGGIGYGMELHQVPERVTITNNLELGSSSVQKKISEILGIGSISESK